MPVSKSLVILHSTNHLSLVVKLIMFHVPVLPTVLVCRSSMLSVSRVSFYYHVRSCLGSDFMVSVSCPPPLLFTDYIEQSIVSGSVVIVSSIFILLECQIILESVFHHVCCAFLLSFYD